MELIDFFKILLCVIRVIFFLSLKGNYWVIIEFI
ncbi:Uncharacterised protein [Salmonella enterica]|nr:Uncharacterised protein [Salmonella enterica]